MLGLYTISGTIGWVCILFLFIIYIFGIFVTVQVRILVPCLLRSLAVQRQLRVLRRRWKTQVENGMGPGQTPKECNGLAQYSQWLP